jgi:hypothetical protein
MLALIPLPRANQVIYRGLLAARDADAAEAFRTRVHARHNLPTETGQGSVGVAGPRPAAPVGDFPTPRDDGTRYA